MRYKTAEKVIPYNRHKVYTLLSDFRNLETIIDKLPEGTPTLSIVDRDHCQIAIPMAGSLELYFKEKEENERLVIGQAMSALPLQFEFTLSLLEKGLEESTLTIELDADIPTFALAMIGEKKIKNGIEKIAEVLAKIDYSKGEK